MNKNNRDMPKLCEEYLGYMQTKEYAIQYIRRRKLDLEILQIYMQEKEATQYNAEICAEFTIQIYECNQYTTNSIKRRIIKAANALLEYLIHGYTHRPKKRRKYTYTGKVGECFKAYLNFRQRKCADSTLKSEYLYLERLNIFLAQLGISDISSLNADIVLKYIDTLSKYSAATVYTMLSSLKSLLIWIHDKKLTSQNLSYIVPKSNYKRQAKLPSVYTEEEVKNLLSSIDRNSPMGKRDYAILLIAAKLGLRASDIIGLNFGNIIWEKNIISLKQHKTNKLLELPILADVGNAIIDYLKYGRAISDSQHIFLRSNAPYTELNNGSIYNITKRCISNAGIKGSPTRRQGPHALRHSLASALLERKTPLPIITEILGHKNTESTKVYLRIDLKALKQCALDVPSAKFYKEGGII